jgi:hypothetical protein
MCCHLAANEACVRGTALWGFDGFGRKTGDEEVYEIFSALRRLPKLESSLGGVLIGDLFNLLLRRTSSSSSVRERAER